MSIIARTRGGDGFNAVAPGDYRDWRSQTHGFEDMAAMRGYGGILSGVHSELPEVAQSAGGSANLFPLLGVAPAFGRNFTEAEDQPKGEPVVLLTWSLFQRRFAGDPSIIGKQIHLDTIPTTVVGVLPSWFTYPDARIQYWLPYAQTFSESDYGMHDGHQSEVVARLKPDVSAEAATHEVSAVQYRIHLANASKPVAEDVWSRPMIDDLVKGVRTQLLVLLCAVGCMLLIACLNLSNLLVARAAARRKEVAIRGSLGGSRLALIREQMTESLLICVAGGGLGLLLSLASTHWLAANWRNLPRADSVHVDGWVFTFAAGLVVVTGLLAGLVPAILPQAKGCSRRCRNLHDRPAAAPRERGCARRCLPRDRAHGHAAGLGRAAFQELSAPAHGGSGLPHRSRNHHEDSACPKSNTTHPKRWCASISRCLSACAACPACAARRSSPAAPGTGPQGRQSFHDPREARTQLQPFSTTRRPLPPTRSTSASCRFRCCAAGSSPNTSASATTITSSSASNS